MVRSIPTGASRLPENNYCQIAHSPLRIKSILNHLMPTEPAEPSVAPDLELFLATGDPVNPQPAFLGFTITVDNGYVVTDENMTFETWERGMRALHTLEGAVELAKARHMAFGVAKFGRDKVDACFGQLELPLTDVKRALDISTIPPEIKYRNLDADHYVVLARAELTPTKLKHWAKVASLQALTPSILKASIAAGEVVSSATAAQQQHGIVSLKGVRQEFDIWLNRVGGIRGIYSMDKKEPGSIQDIIEDLEPFAELYSALVGGRNESERKTSKAKATKKPAKKRVPKKK